ncbi:MAG: purD [Gammaproteobacteria bacterium]|jgi:phosphoribosylamine--glycine ligase|nr:purD [Gammaproteobacteria bacterium]
MNILVIGSGAREHAIIKALRRSPQNPFLYCCATTCNPGIRQYTKEYWIGDICNVGVIAHLAQQWAINIAIIGPEAPLEQGLADVLKQNNISVIGPPKKLAQIETSKAFTRDLLKKYAIPGSPLYRSFSELSGTKDFLQTLGEGNYVIKANGLMGGKGVKVAGDHLHSMSEAYQFCEELQQTGQSFIIEEKCVGQEFSMLCFCDGNSLVPMPLVQDHKRAFINDEGPNTGGMGSYSDANHRLPFLTEKEVEQAQHINEAVMEALTAEFRERYVGILYGSFMATRNGVRLIEYNARFGDPEALNVLAILESDFVAICEAMIGGKLQRSHVQFANLATVCKYAVPEGYPDSPVKNQLIDVSSVQNLEQLYFAAVNDERGGLYATGSRAVAVVGIAETLSAAEKLAEIEINRIKGKLFHRCDIGTSELIERRVRQMKELRECYV